MPPPPRMGIFISTLAASRIAGLSTRSMCRCHVLSARVVSGSILGFLTKWDSEHAGTYCAAGHKSYRTIVAPGELVDVHPAGFLVAEFPKDGEALLASRLPRCFTGACASGSA